jgi:hypothetical protein
MSCVVSMVITIVVGVGLGAYDTFIHVKFIIHVYVYSHPSQCSKIKL